LKNKKQKLTMKLKTTTAVAASALLGMSAAQAAVSITQVVNANGNGNATTSIDGTGADKLVVFVTGEHGFNNTNGQSNDVTYNGVSLTEVVNRDPVASGTDTLFGSIWYMDSPVAGVQTLFADNTSRGNMYAFMLSGTAAGVGDSGFSGSDTRSLDLTTVANSLVLGAFNIGGGGNSAALAGITGDAPFDTQHGGQENGSNWDGHYLASHNGTTAGTIAYSFTGGNATGAFVSAIEILDAAPIPEPSSTALLGLGGLALIFRRRK
jgi:hypothetical protein